jgi:hypothetical protein
MMMCVMLTHRMMVPVVFWPIHHAEHAHPPRSDKADDQDCRQHQKDEIEHGRIVPLDARGQCHHVAVLWNDPKGGKRNSTTYPAAAIVR